MFPGQKIHQKCFNGRGSAPEPAGELTAPHTTSWISGEERWRSEWKEGKVKSGKERKERKGIAKRKGEMQGAYPTYHCPSPTSENPGTATA